MRASPSSSCLFVRSGSRLVSISFGDIEYIRGCDDYIKIFFRQKKPVLSHISMNDILERLPTGQFMRIHRSFIIPVSKITHYRKGRIFLGEPSFPVGTTYLPLMRKILNSSR
jgi:DNA-binding LytR/AlgR family response regulator